MVNQNLSDATPTPVPLSSLPRGARATVCQQPGCCSECELLNAMGMIDRCQVRVCRKGNPLIIQVASTRLGISSTMAQHIRVLPNPSTH